MLIKLMGKPLSFIFIFKFKFKFSLACLLILGSNAFHPTATTTTTATTTRTFITTCSKNSITTCQMEPTTILTAASAAAAAAASLLYLSGSEERAKRAQYAEWEQRDREIRAERARLAYIAPREVWTEDDLLPYDGTNDDEKGPILMGVNGEVYNVWKGRHFYGPGCEYHIFAGRDATRLLAKSKLEEETQEELQKELNMAERAALQGWIYTFKTKYEVVGKLDGFDPSSTTTRTTT